MSYLTNIQTALVSAIESMTLNNGYNYDYSTTQQEDFNKCSFPLINIYLLPSEDTMEPDEYCINEMRNYSRWQLHCFNKAITETTNNKFINNYVLFAMLHDIKKMIGNNYTLNGLVEGILYRKSFKQPSGMSEDIFITDKLIVEVDIPYTEAI